MSFVRILYISRFYGFIWHSRRRTQLGKSSGALRAQSLTLNAPNTGNVYTSPEVPLHRFTYLQITQFLKKSVFRDVTPCGSCKNRRFGGTWRLLHQLSFEVFTAVNMKKGVFWDVTPCGSCKNRRFGGTWRLLHPDEGGARFLRNVGSYKIHTAYRPRRHLSSDSPP
jgi:hypothetical protein